MVYMKVTIVLKGQEYDNSTAIADKYGITYMTLYKWTKAGLLPQPVKLGRRVFYNRQAVENYLLGSE
jgi:predicted DNA-binding transcriptional regulator AlpA